MLRTIARFRTVLLLLGLLVCFTEPLHGVDALWWVGLVLIVAGVVLFFVPGGVPDREPVVVRSPVRGRWAAVNSPADKVPSHGTHELGQTYAIDLVHVPDPGRPWTPLRRWPLAARPETFPAFGQDVLAPADGVVVQASGWQRDHWSRNSWPAFLYLLAEGMLFRQLLSLLTLSGGRFVVGNSVTLDLGGGVYAVFAHLRRGSVRVAKGDRVRAGDVLGEVGNSGNTSEPHLHFHLMDRPGPLVAAGIPFAFPYETGDRPELGAPSARTPFTATGSEPGRAHAG
ncbi:M23 family metallopeptidase [Actinomadura bangladeshensis]|uniref:M23 family metallopeptidase n=1 Tax=Actinomadura bangladeshensis TaxID=453573 RepID=A0A6L9QVF5_9ACTN|nr:M23 family metallopeptidase [Actinomadura bangladeshensis]NEA29371.1 M23 family metallopeptidase [Actinomadura bangladeshensis]